MTYFTTNTSPDYSVVVTSPKAAGSFSFHLAHPRPVTDQILSYTRALLPQASSQVQFKSRLGWATTNQVARVQVSLDQGSSWNSVYSQAGTGSSGEGSFITRTVSQGTFAGRSTLVRFVYDHTSGNYYYDTDSGVGWYIDDISFTGTEELANPVVSDIASGTNFTFTPTQAGDYALEVRAKVYDSFFLEWGQVKRVTATATALMSLQFTGSPSISGGQIQVNFDVANYRSGAVFQLWKAPDPAGTWSMDAGASFQIVTPNTKFRFTTSTGGASKMFYRVQAN